ncbi:uncharacterized protein ALTATR162_LOCUS1814 [Alternaria atra]|jgi:hypothetical protein|uniref:Uncharacterized protein n=1 Tax=Alternaria atra TaxID=119953 RepID=A0A8J2I011_9PLEO|nr:uncharacterized protein ALTATR162_LOCUS1814 [Alternaria atra]CAG5146041.1 unnamed protein product [Alternaria atra]
MEELKMLEFKDFQTYVGDQYRDLFSVYILAEKAQDLATKNAMLEAALATNKLKGRETTWIVPAFYIVKAIYNGTPPGSPARRFVTDLCTSRSIGDISKHVEHLPRDFVQNLGESINKARPGSLGNIAVQKGIAAYQEKPKEV